MTTWKENISLDHEKSKRLFTITDEIKKMRAIGKKVIKQGRTDLPSTQKDEAVQAAKFMLKEVNTVTKIARKLHFLGATPEVVQQLDEIIGVVKGARIELENISKTVI